jgi:hypothetical protein
MIQNLFQGTFFLVWLAEAVGDANIMLFNGIGAFHVPAAWGKRLTGQSRYASLFVTRHSGHILMASAPFPVASVGPF